MSRNGQSTAIGFVVRRVLFSRLLSLLFSSLRSSLSLARRDYSPAG